MNSNRISVLIFCDVNGYNGGVCIYSLQLLKACQQGCIDAYLVSHQPISQKGSQFLRLLTEKSKGTWLIPNGITDKEIMSQIISYAEKIKPDWYFPNYRYGAHGAMVTLKKNGVKNMFVCHNDHVDQYRYAYRYQKIIDLFVCPSRKCEAVLMCNLRSESSPRIKYIPHCVDNIIEQEEKREPSDNNLTLIYCGRLSIEQKRLDFIPAICKILSEKKISYKVIIVGDGEDLEKIRELFDARDEHRIFFCGYVDRSDLHKFYSVADIAILTSSYEGFCLGLAEAMGAGLPAVAFDCGGAINDYLKDGVNGYIVPFGNVDIFVERLLDARDHYIEYSKNARNLIRAEFSFEFFAKNYQNSLESKNSIPYKWPLLRPHLIPDATLGFDGIIEKVGKRLLGWD